MSYSCPKCRVGLIDTGPWDICPSCGLKIKKNAENGTDITESMACSEKIQ